MSLRCRCCDSDLTYTFLDLGVSPLANSYVSSANETHMEPFYPLHAYVCAQCLLVQLGQVDSPNHIFEHYAYFSSYSSSWLAHAKGYAEMARLKFQLTTQSQVIEIASNDGYLLQYFEQHHIQTLGIEPAHNVAEIARGKGIETIAEFFGEKLAKQLVQEGLQGDLIVANNVLAHVPDLHDFVAGLTIVLKPEGTLTIEFPHVLNLMKYHQFDTIYHEHFSYFSLLTLQTLFAQHQLQVVDVEELETHGGSLRLFVKHIACQEAIQTSVVDLLNRELEHGLHLLDTYLHVADQVKRVKVEALRFLIEAYDQGQTIAGYGAPAKGNTFLNFCGIGTEFIAFTVDQNPHKQGMLLPGTRIPIRVVDELRRTKPDYVVILPWNLKQEIMQDCAFIREWGGKFVVFIPELEVV
ncbi:class I SAM-dependent methyltransferase [Paenibacillus sp. N1-5-1-14]|uniref:class I SAM-dependent methyltransferase n=1 Tax=Paenibacillus radicibacter TaxID=2972488 RepID=UPI00215904AC|nr:class I SAM-dependent methyltransferase [Paenibacillus radicibacter]MCR8643447.1 class I SAM-dependent methyltransferase [Paenibacillus radicibacter]